MAAFNFKELLGESFAVVEKVAPTLASAVGSPAAGTATMFALNLLAHAFGVPVNNLDGAIATDTSATDRLSQLETTFGPLLRSAGKPCPEWPWPATIELKVSWDTSRMGPSTQDNPASTPNTQ